MPRFSLRTLMIVLALGPPGLAGCGSAGSPIVNIEPIR